MDNDADWVEEVRRWCLGGRRGSPGSPGSDSLQAAGDTEPVGYEAAHPALEARYWPDAVSDKGLTLD